MPTSSLSNTVKRLWQENKELSVTNPVMDAFDLKLCRIIDEEAREKPFLNKKRKACLEFLRGCHVGHSDKLRQAFESYSEAANFLLLADKINVEAVPESGAIKTPDFKLIVGDVQLYAELKTLNYSGGNINLHDAVDNGLQARIQQIEQQKRGQDGCVVVALDPYKKGSNYDQKSVKTPIEVLIEKIKNNLVPEQFELGDTALLVDLSMLPLASSNTLLTGIPYYQEETYKSYVSGILWNVAFGRVGDPIYRTIECEGKPNLEGRLDKNGILIDAPYIKGLCFRTMKWSVGRKTIGFWRYGDVVSVNVKTVFNEICDFQNSDVNCQGWRLINPWARKEMNEGRL